MDHVRITHKEDDDGPACWEPLSDSEDDDGWETDGEDEEEVASTILPLLSVPSTLAKPNDFLCDVCQALGLSPRQFVVLPSEGLKGDEADDSNIRLGYVGDMQKKSHCPLCRLVLRALGPALPAYEEGE